MGVNGDPVMVTGDGDVLSYKATAATRPIPIERDLKADILTILAVYQQYYCQTNQLKR